MHVHNAEFWLHDGLMYGKHLPHEPTVSLDDVIHVFQKLREMTGGTPVPLLFDGRGIGWLGIEARAYMRVNVSALFTCAAVIVKHDLVRILSHAFLGLAGMDMPVEVFTDEEKAYAFATSHSSAA